MSERVVGWASSLRTRVLSIGCAAVGSLYLAKAIYRGLSFTQGDFYFTLPGEYARRLNPQLWNSPDLRGALDFNHGAYMYGPSQYLTLFPIVFLNSYGAIAAALLAIYPLVLLGACYVLWRLVVADEPKTPGMGAAIFAIMFAFLPLTQSLIQREFEVVALLALVAACAWFVRGRDVLSGAAIAYLTWFKYWPVVLLGVFVVNRRLKGLAGFAGATVVLLLATQLLFGLEGFLIGRTANIIGGLVRPLGSGEVLYPAIPRGALKSDFCRQWIWGRGTAADVRWALCGVEDRFPWVPARAAFIAIVAITGLVFLWAGIVLGSRPLNVVDAKWRGIWEFSLLTIAGGTFVHAHYYYFIVFVLPLSALVFFYATRPDSRRPVKIALWAVAYVLLNAFMIPASWLTRLLKQDAWSLYLDSGFCLLGLLMLLGLVLWEFSRLAVESRAVAHA